MNKLFLGKPNSKIVEWIKGHLPGPVPPPTDPTSVRMLDNKGNWKEFKLSETGTSLDYYNYTTKKVNDPYALDSTLSNTNNLREVQVVANEVTAIGYRSFYQLGKLSAFLHDNILSVGNGALYSTGISSFNFDNVISIDTMGFYGTKLDNAYAPNLITLGYTVFLNCFRLSSAIFPELTSTGSSVFRTCYTLSSVNLPKLIRIEQDAFTDCSGLISIDLQSTIKIWNTAFKNCINLTSINCPNANFIRSSAFQNCSKLKHLILSSMTETILLEDQNAFAGTDYPVNVYVKNAEMILTLRTSTYSKKYNWLSAETNGYILFVAVE